MPLRYKLSIYFMAFSAIMLIFLWVFQLAFLETCYTLIKQAQVKDYASQVSTAIKNGEDTDTINSVLRQNEMSVYVYDSSDTILEKKYTGEFGNPAGIRNMDMHEVYSYYRLARDNGGRYTNVSTYEERGFSLDFNRDNTAETDSTHPTHDTYDTPPATDDEADRHISVNNHHFKGENLIYAEIITLDDDTECFVLITALVTPVDSVISTLRVQLIIVSVVFIVFALVLAFLVSKRISRPLDEINEKVKQFAVRNYDVEFNSVGYLEAKELSDTLNVTRQELQKAENLRQELIANISHDLRTPLTMITGYSEVMRDIPGENTPENVQVIIDEANRLTSLVNDMLDLSKLQSGAIEIEREDFNLTDAIQDIFERYTKLREQEGYDIQFKADRNAYVSADQIKIGQVIYNFINNAINHCGEDKTVIVTQKVSDKRVRIEVTDHGEGIPADKLEYIWDRYYKVDKDHKRGVIGTGLGLSIVKKILDLHGAKYGVKSREGHGSTFWFELECRYSEKFNS